MIPERTVLPTLILSQFLCTSLWFAGNAVIPELVVSFHLAGKAAGHLASAVQLGFIIGTFLYAYLAISDRFPPSKVFFFSAILAAIGNFGIVFYTAGLNELLVWRGATGFFLAGIYPVGMKIASDHFGKDLGKVLGYLVGALVLGTALPHLVNYFSASLSWSLVFTVTSILCVVGGVLVLFIPRGEYSVPAIKVSSFKLSGIFENKAFRQASFGYFGHMWELYSFWAFVPFIIVNWTSGHESSHINTRILSFIIIATGSIGCVLSGRLSQRFANSKIAVTSLLCSGLCCCFSPFIYVMPPILFIAFMTFWSVTVIADSPMFSSLVAQNAPAASRGSALTIVTCIGFAITIMSIELLNVLINIIAPSYLFLFLIPGPLIGIFAMRGQSKPAFAKNLDLL